MAEAPRRQYAQVGESRRTMRVRSAASLNCCLNWSRLLRVSEVSGGWPCGVRLKPQKYQPTIDTKTPASKSTYFRFSRMTKRSASYQVSNDLGYQDNHKNYRGSYPEQHDAETTALLTLIC